MPSWKKIIQSGSKADLSQITASDGILSSKIDASELQASSITSSKNTLFKNSELVNQTSSFITIGNSWNEHSYWDVTTGAAQPTSSTAEIKFKFTADSQSGDDPGLMEAGKIVAGKQGWYNGTNGQQFSNLKFFTAFNGVERERMIIQGGLDSAPRVGIGTKGEVPVVGLTVQGNISASGIVYATNFLSSSVAGNLPVDGNVKVGGYIWASGSNSHITASGDISASAGIILGGVRRTTWPSGGGGTGGIFRPTGSKQATTNTVEISGSLKVSGSSTFTNIGTFKQTGNTTMSGSVTLVPKTGEVFTFRAGDFVQIKKPISGIKEVQISGSLRVSGSNSFKVEGPTQLTGSFAITKPDDNGNDLIIDDTGFIYSGSKMRVTGSIATKGGGSFSSTLTTAGVSNTGTITSTGNISTDTVVLGATSSFFITEANKFLPKESFADIGKFDKRIRKLYMASEIDTSGSLVMSFHSGSNSGLVISASEVSASDSVFQVNIKNNTDGLTKDALYVSSSGNVRVGIGMEQPDQDFSNAGNTRLGTFGNESSLHIPSDMAWWVEDAQGSQLHTGLFEQDPQYSPSPTTMSVVTSDGLEGGEYSSQVWIPWISHSLEGQMPLTTTWQTDSEWDDNSDYAVVSGSLLTGSGDGTYPHEVLIFSASDTYDNDGQFGYVKEYNDLQGVYNYSFYTWYNNDGISGVPVLPAEVSESLRSGLYKYKVKLQKMSGTGPNYIEATSSQAFPIDLWWITNNEQYDTGSQEFMTGDVNGDGSVDILDVVKTVNHILGTEQLTGDGLQSADFNHDDSVDITDVVGLINHILGTEATSSQAYSTSDETNNFVQESNIAYFNTLTQMSASINNSSLSTTQKLLAVLDEANNFNKSGYVSVGIKHPHMTMFKRDTTNDKIIYPMETQKGNNFNSLNGVLEGSTLVINNTPYIVEEVNSSSPVTSVTLDSGLPPQTVSGSSFRHYRPRGLYSPQREGTYNGKVTSKGVVVRSDNRVGIGTSAPQALLHISSSQSGSRGTADDLMKITNKDNVNVFKISKESEVLIRNATNSSKSASLKVDSSDNLLINDIMKVNHKEVIFKSGSTEVTSTVDPSSGQIKFKKSDGTYFAMKGAEIETKDTSGKIVKEVFEDGKKFTRSGSSTSNQVELQQNAQGAFISVSGSTPGYNIIKTGATNDYRLMRQKTDFFYADNKTIFTIGVDGDENMWFVNPSISGVESNTISALRVSASGDSYFKRNASFGGDLIVSGAIQADSMNVTHFTSSFITASTIQTSGSNIFGDESTDTHKFVGHITASANISSSGNIITNEITASGNVIADKFESDGGLIVAYAHNNDVFLGYDSSIDEVKIGKFTTQPVKIAGNITASGDISSSGKILATDGFVATGNSLFVGNLNVQDIYLTNLTASANISSSGNIYGSTYYSNGEILGLNHAGTMKLATGANPTIVRGSTITLSANITASGDISSSGTIIGDTATFGYYNGNISASGGIYAGTTGTTLANTGHISSSQYDLGGYYNGSQGFSHQNLWRFSASAQSNEGQAANLEMYNSGVRVNKLTTEIGGTSFFGAGNSGGLSQKFGFNTGPNPQDVGITVGGQISASGNLEIDGNATIDGVLTATRKSFLIPHPTKEDKKLQYASLEGPENGVYIRGKLKGDNIIKLPDYWSELVDEDTISVSLTPIGRFQYLYVRDISLKEVMVGSDKNPKRNIYCHYVIYAERKDIDKLEVEI